MFDFDEDDTILDEIARAVGEHIPPFYFFVVVILLFGLLTYLSWQAMMFATFIGTCLGVLLWLMQI